MTEKDFSINIESCCIPEIYGDRDFFKEVRRDIHRNPEIGLETFRTADKIEALLKEFGVDTIERGLSGSSVIATINGNEPSDFTVGLRADIDALPLKELSDHDHVSEVEGKMHGCGHDGHAAILLSTAKYLAQHRDFKGRVVLIFQPGEEGWSGAKHMIDEGLFDKYPMNEVYAIHNSSMLPVGKVALNYGAMQAAADAFTITINGKGGHGSRPHLNRDPILAAAQIIVALQSVVSREVDPLETAVISCCSIHAGDPKAQSVCPESCQIVGTARTFSPEVRDLVEKRLVEVSETVAKAFGCTAKADYQRFYPPCVNTKEQAAAIADVAESIVGPSMVDRNFPRMPGGEDFAFMLQKVPGAYIRVGQSGAAAHNPYYDYNDDITPLAATIFVKTVQERLKKLSGVN